MEFMDIILFGGVVAGMVFGYRSGATRRMYDLFMFFFAVLLASRLMVPVGKLFKTALLLPDPHCYVVSLIAIVGSVIALAMLFAGKFEGAIVKSEASQFFGVILGGVESALVVSVLLLLLNVYDTPGRSSRDESLLYHPLVTFAPDAFDIVGPAFPGSEEFREDLSRVFERYAVTEKSGGNKEKL